VSLVFRKSGRVNVATYQLVPYLISVHPRGTHGAEIRPIEDLDANGTKLGDLLSYTLQGSIGRGPYRFPKSEDKSFRVADFKSSAQTLYATVTQGNRGIQSRINDEGTVVFERKSNHIEDIDFRNLIVLPRHGSYALMLTEKIGNYGVSSFLRKIITDTLGSNFHDVTVEVKALTTAADLNNANILLRGMEFQFPRRGDASGRRMGLTGPDGSLALRYKFRAATRLSNYTNATGEILDSSKVFGVLDTGLAENGLNVTGERLKELGLQADLQVTLPSGNHRSFTMGVDAGPALAYTLEPASDPGSGETDADRYKPSEEDFLRVAKEIVSDVAGNFGISETTSTYCVVPTSSSVEVPNGWEVVWNVPDHIAPDSP
jgi:hypothetical protein